MRPPKKKPTATKLCWRVSIMRARGQHVGTVEAESREAAEASSVKTFKLTEEQRKRLSIWERDGCRSPCGQPASHLPSISDRTARIYSGNWAMGRIYQERGSRAERHHLGESR